MEFVLAGVKIRILTLSAKITSVNNKCIRNASSGILSARGMKIFKVLDRSILA